MKLMNKAGVRTNIPNANITSVSFPKAREVSIEDCAGNGITPDATVINISLKGGLSATFAASEWTIVEV